jgi:hypothetical protein
MWRAYGGSGGGVGLVLKSKPFLSESAALKVYSSPVAYLDENGIAKELGRIAEAFEVDADELRTLDHEMLATCVFMMLRFSVVCTKHPGFAEEREWRAIYNPCFETSERVSTCVESIAGTPQLVTKVPLKDYPDEGLVGLQIPDLLDRVIIGPTRFPAVSYEAFVRLLEQAGVPDASTKVVVSHIPLR